MLRHVTARCDIRQMLRHTSNITTNYRYGFLTCRHVLSYVAGDVKESYGTTISLHQYSEPLKRKALLLEDECSRKSRYRSLVNRLIRRSRSDPHRAWDAYKWIIRREALKYLQLEQVRALLTIFCNNITESTFEWLTQITNVLRSTKFEQLIPNAYLTLLFRTSPNADTDEIVNVIKQMDRIGWKLKTKHVAVIVRFYGKQGDLKCARKVFDAILETNIKVDAEGFHTLADMYRISGDADGALETLRRYIITGQAPTTVLYGVAIDAFCKNCNMEVAEELFEEMLQCFVPASLYIFTSLIHGYAKKCELQMATKFYQKMYTHGLVPDKYVYTTMIVAHLRVRDLQTATRFYQSMIEQGISHDKHIFAALIYMRGVLSDAEGAMSLLDEMKAANIAPSIVNINQLIWAHGRVEGISVSKIQELCRYIINEKMRPNDYTFNILVNAFSRRWAFPLAIEVVRLMNGENRPLTNATLNPLIRQLVLAQESELAWEFYDRMISAGIVPNMHLFTTMLAFATVSSEFDIIFRAYRSLICAGEKLPLETYGALITAFAKGRKPEYAILAFRQMIMHDIIPNRTVLTALIQGLSIARRFADAMAIYRVMLRIKLKPDRMSLYHMEKLHKRTGHLKELEEFNKQLRKLRINFTERGSILQRGLGTRSGRMKMLIHRRIYRQQKNDPSYERAFRRAQKERKMSMKQISFLNLEH